MAVRFTPGPNGSLEIAVSLTPSQSAALGMDQSLLADWFDTALWALALLRTGRDPAGELYDVPPEHWRTAISDLDRKLIPHLEGIRDAAMRAHAASGGSVGNLARAMDVSRSTAQYRREVLRDSTPSRYETWAAQGGPKARSTD